MYLAPRLADSKEWLILDTAGSEQWVIQKCWMIQKLKHRLKLTFIEKQICAHQDMWMYHFLHMFRRWNDTNWSLVGEMWSPVGEMQVITQIMWHCYFDRRQLFVMHGKDAHSLYLFLYCSLWCLQTIPFGSLQRKQVVSNGLVPGPIPHFKYNIMFTHVFMCCEINSM